MACSVSLTHAALLNILPESVEAEAWIILDPQSKQVIAEHNSHVERAPASLTKMMVAYITLQEIHAGRLKMSDVLTAPHMVTSVMSDESQMKLNVGEQITVDRLLAGLIIMSANDAALTLGEHISGSTPQFVARMNQEAQKLGMKDTHFSNPSGITMADHYSTAHDLALLSEAVALQTPEYLTYSKQQSFAHADILHHATNLLLQQDPSVDGLKTGFTKAAGYNLALTAHRPAYHLNLQDRRLIVVVLGTKSALKRADVAHRLMNLAYSYTRDELAIQNKQILAEVPVIKSSLRMFTVEAQQPQLITTSLYSHANPIDLKSFDMPSQRIMLMDENQVLQKLEPLTETKVHMNIEMKQKKLIAPVEKVMQLATIHVYQNDQFITSFPIEENVHIEEANIFERLMIWVKGLFGFIADESFKTYPLSRG